MQETGTEKPNLGPGSERNWEDNSWKSEMNKQEEIHSDDELRQWQSRGSRVSFTSPDQMSFMLHLLRAAFRSWPNNHCYSLIT